ncbi:MAG: PEP-CTERM sorting domain-containing protein [Candidatus Acidiferrum sp.]
MSTRKSICLVAAIFLISAYSTLAATGTRKDLGASNNGVDLSFADCLASTTVNCGNFTAAPVSTIDGVPVFNFVTNDGLQNPDSVAVFDVFQLPGTIAPNSTVTFTFNSLTGNYGAFACDNGTEAFALSSTNNPLTGPCTVGATDSLASFLSETDGVNTATFTFLGGAGFPTSWTFYTDKGNLAAIDFGGTTTTPEPSSLVLLLAGALVVGLASTKRS